MVAKEEKSNDFYEVLGLKKECSDAELRNAYKKLALKWHPDRCSSSGNSKHIEEAKKKFQAIQEAYSVLSDGNKRFLYDVGVDDNDENGMGDFLNEMAAMMSQNKSNDSRKESFEDLQELFEEMFQSDDIQAFTSSSRSGSSACSASSFYTSCSENYNGTNKRNSSEISLGNFEANASQFEGFCLGAEHQESSRRGRGGGGGGREAGGRIPRRAGSSRRGGRKQKVSSVHDVSSDH